MAKRDHFGWTHDHIEKILKFQELPGRPLIAYLYRRFKTLGDALRAWRLDRPETEGTSLVDARQRFLMANAAANEFVPKDFPAFVNQGLSDLDTYEEKMSALLNRLDARFKERDEAAHSLIAILSRESAGFRRDAADRLLRALGSNSDFEKVRTEALSLVTEAAARTAGQDPGAMTPEWLFLAELGGNIPPLIELYASPRKFFVEMAPKVWPYDFARLGADPGHLVFTPGPLVLLCYET
jgi:hypothetical protein